ncbi:MAG TPA: energy transducer TonB [Candidatus Eisenbacteria bacterium]
MIPVHPSYRYRRRYYRRVFAALALATAIHLTVFVVAPPMTPRAATMRPSPLRLIRLAASFRAGAPAEAREAALAPATPAGPGGAPETFAATRVVTEPAPAATRRVLVAGGDAAAGAGGSTLSGEGTIESEDAVPPVFYRYDTAPRVIRRVEPDYPAAARARGEEGTVVVNVNIDEKGRILRAWVAATSASEALVNAAIDAIYLFEFTPGEERGIPVRCTVAIPFSFTLMRTP